MSASAVEITDWKGLTSHIKDGHGVKAALEARVVVVVVVAYGKDGCAVKGNVNDDPSLRAPAVTLSLNPTCQRSL